MTLIERIINGKSVRRKNPHRSGGKNTKSCKEDWLEWERELVRMGVRTSQTVKEDWLDWERGLVRVVL